ncbi:MAG: hypothetical protein HKN78_09870 [Sphingomonadaceae bacterium]|nr:hypothetical protein [Sphingomonadaceae bacterium]
MHSLAQEKSPKAGLAAKGDTIAHVETIAKSVNYAESVRKCKRKHVSAIGPHGSFAVTGQVAKALLALVEADEQGVTAQECDSSPNRLGAYVHTLRRRRELIIETVREPHDGGWHGRYVLHSPVTILEAEQ